MIKKKRQGLIIKISELKKLVKELEKQKREIEKEIGGKCNDRFQINIINKTPECSDTWELEK